MTEPTPDDVRHAKVIFSKLSKIYGGALEADDPLLERKAYRASEGPMLQRDYKALQVELLAAHAERSFDYELRTGHKVAHTLFSRAAQAIGELLEHERVANALADKYLTGSKGRQER